MKGLASIVLRSLLAIALVAGSLPALSMSQTMSSMQLVDQPVEETSDHRTGNCHPTDARSADDGGGDHQSCCAEQADCQHEYCDCACPALTLVVPSRLSTAQRLPARIGLSSLTPRSPRNIIDTPLRPPQA